MRIGIDISITKINQAGTAIYTTNLVKALQKIDDQNDLKLFAIKQFNDMSTPKSIQTRLNTIYRDIIWMNIVLPWQTRLSQIDVLHMPANIIPLHSPCKTIVSFMDAIVFKSPQQFPLWQRTYARLLMPFAAKQTSRIITISEQSKQDIVKFLKIPKDRVVITYLAAALEFRLVSQQFIDKIRHEYNLDQFILTVGTLEPRKNILRLLQAFALLRQDGFNGLLIHVGPKGWMYDDILAEVQRLDLHNNVRFLGRVPLQDLAGLYNAAQLFVYPSLYEGFGLPVLEAMSCGCPVITSNISSLPEVSGDAGILVDPYDIQQLATAMQEVLSNTSKREKMIEHGLHRSKLFSWERCAQETLAVYHQVFNHT